MMLQDAMSNWQSWCLYDCKSDEDPADSSNDQVDPQHSSSRLLRP